MDTVTRNILAASISNKVVALDKKLTTAKKRLGDCDGERDTHLATFKAATAEDSTLSPEVQALVSEGYASFGRILKVKRDKLEKRVTALTSERAVLVTVSQKLASGEEISADAVAAAVAPSSDDAELARNRGRVRKDPPSFSFV